MILYFRTLMTNYLINNKINFLMRTFSKVLFMVLIGSLFLSSCVSSKKYKDLVADKDAMEAKYEKKIAGLSDKLKAGEEKNAKLNQNVKDLEGELSMANKAKMELKNLSDQKAQELDKIKGEITEAFASINDSDLKVVQKFDKLYISMPNRVLYKKGVAKLSKDGMKVVDDLAQIFKNNPKMDILVEGHTDSDPVKRTRYMWKDNWGLSSARAVNVVRELVKLGVPSKQLSASGRADAYTTGELLDGKDPMAYDRRIEFIVTPDVHKLYSISQSIK
jgi:chemotaxis protein MotB